MAAKLHCYLLKLQSAYKNYAIDPVSTCRNYHGKLGPTFQSALAYLSILTASKSVVKIPWAPKLHASVWIKLASPSQKRNLQCMAKSRSDNVSNSIVYVKLQHWNSALMSDQRPQESSSNHSCLSQHTCTHAIMSPGTLYQCKLLHFRWPLQESSTLKRPRLDSNIAKLELSYYQLNIEGIHNMQRHHAGMSVICILS